MKYNDLDNKYIYSFKSVVGTNPSVLILGTIPGKESLRKEQYYGHPRNIFWKILHDYFQTKFIDDYESRLELAMNNKIALWDVCHTAIRKSSLDKDILKEEPNEIDHLLDLNRSIQVVMFNGKKAESLFDKYFKRRNNLCYIGLLSTSPANASYTYEQKFENWSRALNQYII